MFIRSDIDYTLCSMEIMIFWLVPYLNVPAVSPAMPFLVWC